VTQAEPGSPWAPLRSGVFRVLWLAVLGSQLGTWMQTVGAQWLLVDRPHAETLVPLVQTANMLPVLLLALPGGVLADILDRRRMLITVQLLQVVVAGALAALAFAGQLPPALLLTLTFLLGCGTALTVPTYQAVIPELVPRSQVLAAMTLGSVSMNVARAVGPALAGVLVAQFSVAIVFAANATSFAAFAVALLLWRRPPAPDERSEPFIAALRAGGRYVRHSRVVRRMLGRLILFVFPAACLWALLPVVASQRLGFGAGGYGVLLGALGVGAVVTAPMLARIRANLTDNRLIFAGSIGYAVALAVTALVREPVVVVVVMLIAGACWMTVLTNANADLQMFLPDWVRARGIATYQIVFFGGQAIGAFLWGLVAERVGLPATFLVATALMVLAAVSVRIWPLIDTSGMDRESVILPEPPLLVTPDPFAGPVVTEVTYPVTEGRESEFVEAMAAVGRSRLRTGAVRWAVYRVGERPGRFVEIYEVRSWDEHLRQHSGRVTGTDREFEARAWALCDGPVSVQHLLPPDGLAD
jgi:MFS family permease